MKVQWLKKRRNKRMILKVKGGNIIVSTPFSTSQKEVEAFIEKSKPWIQAQLKKDEATLLKDGRKITLLGKTYQLKKGTSCTIDHDLCIFCTNEKKWKQFLLTIVSEYLTKRFDYWSEIMGYHNLQLKFGFYSSKWGSCRKDLREIRLNAYLVYCPLDSIDAVIVHELCHLKQANHSSKFYEELYAWYPNYQSAHAKLKQVTIYRTNQS